MLEYVREIPRKDAVGEQEAYDFLKSRRFHLVDKTPVTHVYKRSNKLSTMMAFSPSQWRIDLRITRPHNPNLPLKMGVQVHSSGQLVTPRERRYFETYLDEIVAGLSLTESSALIVATTHALAKREARGAFRENVGIVFALAFGMPLLIMVLYATFSLSFGWAVLWGGAGAIAFIYAWVFSAKNRTKKVDRID